MTYNENQALSEDGLLESLIVPELRPEVGRKLFVPLIHHLADLKVLENRGELGWRVNGLAGDLLGVEGAGKFRELLLDLCRRDEGFALKFFLKNLPADVSLAAQEPEGFKGHLSEGLVGEDGEILPKKSSNLSNLQVVKKVGRQLSPLIELENWYLKHLEGTHTTRQEARHLFNFILGKIKPKQEPRTWEQLSRRRHKK